MTGKGFRTANGSRGRARLLPARCGFAISVIVAPVLISLIPPSTLAAELVSVKVERSGARYFVRSESIYAAPPEALFAVLLDYDNFGRVSSVFKRSYYVDPAADGTPRAYTLVEGCVLFFCTEIERIDQIEVERYSHIVAVSEPNPQDFRYSRSEWRFEDLGDATKVYYALEMEPGFWIPPVIGPYFLKRRLVSGAVDAIDRVEAIAQEWASAQ